MKCGKVSVCRLLESLNVPRSRPVRSHATYDCSYRYPIRFNAENAKDAESIANHVLRVRRGRGLEEFVGLLGQTRERILCNLKSALLH